MRRHGIRLARAAEEIAGAIGIQDREGMGDGVALDVMAANVEKPRHAVGQRDRRRRIAAIGQSLAQTGELGLVGFAGMIQRIGLEGRARRGGAVVPDAVHEVGDRGQGDALGGQLGAELGDLVDAMEPRIKADLAALGQMFDQPIGKAHLGPIDRRERLERHLRADLQPVAAIDENARDLWQDNAKARRAGKPRKPRQPRVTGSDILALVRVGAGHNEANQPFRGDLGAKRGKTGRTLIGRRGGFERLEHDDPLKFFPRFCPSCRRNASVEFEVRQTVEPW